VKRTFWGMRGFVIGAAGVAAVLLATALPATAAEWAGTETASVSPNTAAPSGTARAPERPILIQHLRAHDARGLNVFEPPKEPGAPFEGFQLQWGAAFTQQFQGLTHRNDAAPRIVGGVDQNQLIKIGKGFNNAAANLYLDAQLARGIRVALTTYLASRHHNDTWVKDGYLLIDGSPWENARLDAIMQYMTLKLGHFEINYGDQHFRGSDNGEAMFNPLVGNLIMNAFTTEVGGEAYVRAHGLLGMVALTGGEVRGTVVTPDQRSPALIGKLGYDGQVTPQLRLRLTGSVYNSARSANNTLYSGSRAGSRYYYVLENVNATESAQAWSGDLQPGFTHKVRAWVVNPFVKYGDLELFGNLEQAEGRSASETSDRTWRQYAGDGVYRFLHNQLYVAGRYNLAKGQLAGYAPDVSIERISGGGGWFLTQSLLTKLELVRQTYRDYPLTDIHHGGRFDGGVFEAVVSF
jgi:hypothetical protein